MQKHTMLNRLSRDRSTILIVSLLTVGAFGLPQAIPRSAASADDTAASAERSKAPGTMSKPDDALRVRVGDAYGKLPLSFEANRGQTDPQVKFLSRSPRHTLFLASTEAVLVFTQREHPGKGEGQASNARFEKPGKATRTVLRMTFLGANPDARVTGQEELPGKANYFSGNDPAKWRTHVPTYAKVRYQDLYPGIDLIYYGNQRQLEYDFVVRPGADPSRIALTFQGADRLEVDAQGHLVLRAPAGAIHQRKPVIYQEVGGRRVEIPGGYVLRDGHQVGFQVAAYDASRPLVIDPVLSYSTYLGGSRSDEGLGIGVDAAGNAYVTGFTGSTNFPATAGAFQTTFGGVFDAFVTKLNATGAALVYSTYLGGNEGNGNDQGFAIGVDALGNAYVTGFTGSSDFPTTAGAFQTTFGGGDFDAFVTKLNATGAALVYSTYLGGSDIDQGFGIGVDALGNAYVTGFTGSSDFPTTAGAFQTTPLGVDAFVTKLHPTGAALVYSTYLGGSSVDLGRGIAVDAAGNAYVTGLTDSTNFPTTAEAFRTTFGGPQDAFVTKLNAAGAGLVYSSFLGGSGIDQGLAIAVDAAGNAYVTGVTLSSSFPTTAGAFQPTFGGAQDAFVTKLNSTGTALVYSTYLGGGSDLDEGHGIAVDTAGNAYVTGRTQSRTFPTTAGAPQPTFGGGVVDAFVTKLNATGAALVYSTYLGGSDNDQGLGITVDALGNAYVTGVTGSSNFPTTAGAFQPIFGGGDSDAFVTKITDIVLPPGPPVEKVTGGGSVDVPDGTGTFGFIVQREVADGPIHGQLQYVNHATKAKVHSVMFDFLAISGDMATFGGTCTRNGVPCTFTVDVTDNGEPGTDDHFTITVDAGPPEGDTLRSGNIQIHE